MKIHEFIVMVVILVLIVACAPQATAPNRSRPGALGLSAMDRAPAPQLEIVESFKGERKDNGHRQTLVATTPVDLDGHQ